MLEELYEKNEVPEADQLRLAKNIVLVVPSQDFDTAPWLCELGLSSCEVAVIWPKETVNMLAEICAVQAKLVVQVARRFFKKFPYAIRPKDVSVFAEQATEISPDQYVTLHHHDEYSIRDGLGTIKNLVKLLKAQRRSFCCVTNHGSVGGWVRQYKACREAGIKPIFGMEAYYSDYRGDDPEIRKLHRKANHLILLAKTKEGFDNIIRIHNDSQINGFYYSARVNRAALEEWGKGIAATTACFPEDTLVFTEDGFEKINESGFIVTAKGRNKSSFSTSRKYTGRLKEIVCRGVSPKTTSTEEHEYLVVKKTNQKKSSSILLQTEEDYLDIDKQFRTARRRDFYAQWISHVEDGDWLLFPVECPSKKLIRELDTSKYNVLSSYGHRLSISDSGRKIIRQMRK